MSFRVPIIHAHIASFSVFIVYSSVSQDMIGHYTEAGQGIVLNAVANRHRKPSQQVSPYEADVVTDRCVDLTAPCCLWIVRCCLHCNGVTEVSRGLSGMCTVKCGNWQPCCHGIFGGGGHLHCNYAQRSWSVWLQRGTNEHGGGLSGLSPHTPAKMTFGKLPLCAYIEAYTSSENMNIYIHTYIKMHIYIYIYIYVFF